MCSLLSLHGNQLKHVSKMQLFLSQWVWRGHLGSSFHMSIQEPCFENPVLDAERKDGEFHPGRELCIPLELYQLL